MVRGILLVLVLIFNQVNLHPDVRPLLAPPVQVKPIMKCNFEQCSSWRFLERQPKWNIHGFEGGPGIGKFPQQNHSEGYFFTNQTGSAIVASFPLKPGRKQNKTASSHYCVSFVYKMCGNPRNELILKKYGYPIFEEGAKLIWSHRQGGQCLKEWKVQTIQLKVNSQIVLLLNGSRFASEDPAVDSQIQWKNIEIYNSTCYNYMASHVAIVTEPPKTGNLVQFGEESNVTIFEGESLGRIENAADDLNRMYKNESWLITVPELPQNSPKGKTEPVVAVRFSWLDIENSDNCSEVAGLFIYDGPNSSSPLLGSFCGSTRPKEIFTSSSNQVFIEFLIFDLSKHPTGSGFKFTFDTWARIVTTEATTTLRMTTTTAKNVTQLYTYFCDFEDDEFCLGLFKNWELTMFPWLTMSGKMLGDKAGSLPNVDKTQNSETGQFAIALSAGHNPGAVAVLKTQREFSIEDVNCLNFWYYKSGTVTGRLAVWVVTTDPESGREDIKTVMIIRGDRGGEWKNAQIPIPKNLPVKFFKVAFQATVGGVPAGDAAIALDDVGFFKAWWCKTKQ